MLNDVKNSVVCHSADQSLKLKRKKTIEFVHYFLRSQILSFGPFPIGEMAAVENVNGYAADHKQKVQCDRTPPQLALPWSHFQIA